MALLLCGTVVSATVLELRKFYVLQYLEKVHDGITTSPPVVRLHQRLDYLSGAAEGSKN